jgi:uncharacterized protein (TIGR02145 family)
MKNKNRIWFCPLIMLLVLFLVKGCKKGEEDEKITDADANVYASVTIGTQVWMVENLKTIKYKDGTAIAYPGSDFMLWANNTDGAYAWYNSEIANKNTYGALYNWHAVNTGKLCPTGWHVPSGDEWIAMVTYLGDNAGGKLKEEGTVHWQTPNEGATNETGVTALPGGTDLIWEGLN